MMRRRKKVSPFTALNYLLFTVIGVIMVYPFWYVVMYSFSDPAQSSLSSLYLWPQGFTVQSYQYAFSKKILFTGFFNSVFLTLVGTDLNSGGEVYMNPENFKMAAIVITVVPILCVYPLLQKHFTAGVMMGSVKG